MHLPPISTLVLLLSSPLLTHASPLLHPRQLSLPSLELGDSSVESNPHIPFIGAPLGPFYKSTQKVTCDPVRITFGGGDYSPYYLSVVNASTVPPNLNETTTTLKTTTEEDTTTEEEEEEGIETLARLGVMGIPGLTWWDIDDSSLQVGDEVALRVVDGMGNVGYSMSRKVLEGHPNEFCYYPGRFWPPSRWDGNHFVFILLFLFLFVPFTLGFLTGFGTDSKKRFEWLKELLVRRPWEVVRGKVRDGLGVLSLRRRSRRERRRGRDDGDDSDETLGALQLEERLERGEGGGGNHVLGDDDDDEEERTSLEEGESLLTSSSGDRRTRRNGRIASSSGGEETPSIPRGLPPGYDEAVGGGVGERNNDEGGGGQSGRITL